MISALTIAARFIELGIEQGQPVTPMKLQKLLYLAYGIHLVKHNTALFNEPIEAWSYGPVIRSVYDKYKHFGTRPITEIPDLALLAVDVQESVGLAWEIGGELSGLELSNWSHSEGSPWQKTFTPGFNKKINQSVIRTYFFDTMNIEP